MTDIKKDTLKNQLDDALRQGYDANLMINPEMAVVQLNTIMDEQCIKFLDWVLQNYNTSEHNTGLCWKSAYPEDLSIYDSSELLYRYKQENGL